MRRQHRPIGPRGSSSLGRRVPPRPGLIATCALTAALALAACSSVGTGAPPVTGTTGAASTPSTTSPEPTPSTTSPQPTPSTTSASRSGPGQGATALPSTSTDGTEIATAGGETPCPVAAAPFVAVVDEEQVRAAVTVALDASMAVMVEEIAKRVLASLATRKPEPATAPALATTPAPLEAPQAAPPDSPASHATRMEPVRRVSPLRHRSVSILGLDISRPEPESSETDRE